MNNWQNVITDKSLQVNSNKAVINPIGQQTSLESEENSEFKQWQIQRRATESQRREIELKNAAIREWAQQNTQRPIESRTNKTMYGLIATGVALLAIKFGAPESLKAAENLRLIEDVLTILIPLLGALGIHFRNRATKFITKQKAANHARNN